ncbi:MAG: YdeI/OmpD-associated family protein [Coriobacteriia bacterium]|nr:YdeI/OmpD-associated family protein [Coriobacteriia bacterium]
MRPDVPELLFESRGDFREWLTQNAETSEGVWLVFGKDKTVVTISANDALEEALCFGWIDGQMKSVDSSRYLKYFAKRRAKSPWSEKNKQAVERLREEGRMTQLGEEAVETAKRNGMWGASKTEPVSDEQVEAFAQRLAGHALALENFSRMSPSVRRTYTRRYLSFKGEEARQRDFGKIVDRLNNNLKPM